MDFVRKNRNNISLFITIAVLYFIIRLASLTIMPIFTDEAIYLRWAQIALHDSSWRFISLTDGKQPLFVWLAMIFMKFIGDPLVAGRLVSVFSGFFTLVGLWFLSLELFKNKKISFLTTLLYVFFPFAQVYDRMALMDSMVGTFSVWALYFSILLVRKVRLDISYTLGFIIGGGILTKTSNFFSIYLLPFTFLLFNFRGENFKKRFLKWIALSILSILIAYGLYNILRLSPLFSMISTKNATFVYPISEWLMHPFTFFWGNLHGLTDWLNAYLGIAFIALILISLVFIHKFLKEKLILLIYFALPFIALALFGKVIFPRFIYFMSLFLLPLAAEGLNRVLVYSKNISKNVRYHYATSALIIFVVISFPALTCYQLIVNPKQALIASSDNGQYLNNWTAGWGVNDTIALLKKELVKGKVFVGTEGTFGLMPETLELYLVQNKNIVIKGYWPINEFPKEALAYAKKMPAYFIFYQPQHQLISSEFPVKLIYEKRAGNSNYFYRIYKIVPRS